MAEENTDPRETIRLRLTAAALGRLLKGDYDLQVDLGRQVVAACAERYLHQVIKDPAFRLWADQEVKELKEAIKQEVGQEEYVSSGYRPKLRQHVVDLVKREVKEVVQQACAEAFSVVLAEQSKKLKEDLDRLEVKLRNDFESRIKHLYANLDDIATQHLDKNVAKRIREDALNTLNRAVELAKQGEATPCPNSTCT